MGAIIGMVVSGLIGAAQKDAKGKIIEGARKRLSKTKAAINVGNGAGLIAILPAALAGDELSIGMLVVMVIGWGTALWGRHKAG